MKKQSLLTAVACGVIVFCICMIRTGMKSLDGEYADLTAETAATETEPVTELDIVLQPEIPETDEPETEAQTEAQPEETEPEVYIVPGSSVTWSDYDIQIAAHIVQGEAGNQGYYGKQLVAQCLLQGCLDNNATPAETRQIMKYSGWSDNIDEETVNAVKSVFIDGERATERNIKYFYAPKYCNGKWHETQIFVMEYGGHKFFEERK